MISYPGLLATHAADDMVVLSRSPEIVREIDFASMSASELRNTRVILARLLADVDRRLEAVVASDQPDGDPTLTRRIREARSALNAAQNAQRDEQGVKTRASAVRRAMQAKR